MFVNTLVSQLVGSNTRYGNHVGVEIELEHRKEMTQLTADLAGYWRVEGDGSLRVNGAEYVFRDPKTPEIAKRVVTQLGKHIDATNTVIDAGRAGVHVHINVGDLTVRELANFVALYHSLEPLIVNWCGPRRSGNLFCLRLKDAEYIVDKFTEALEGEDLAILHTDDIRYSSINLKAVRQYGSVEFRAMRSDGNWEDINRLIDVLQHLKALARQIDNPVQLVADSSNMSKEAFVDQLLGDYSPMFDKYQGFEDDIEDAIRRVQYYAYCKEW